MIYTSDKNLKYVNGERIVKQISVNVTDCKRYDLENNYVFNSNLCENHMLFLVISGIVNFKNENIYEGSIIYISKFSSYTLTCLKHASLIEIAFEYSDKITLFDKPFRIMDASFEAKDYIEKIYSTKFIKASLPGIKEGLLINLLNTLNVSCDIYKKELNVFKNCREWIEQNTNNYITAQDVAVALSYTPAHLNRIVKKHCGKCLSTLISEARISKIKQLIQYTNYSTEEIALTLQFDSPELLRKYFKYHTGMSLKEYKFDKKF